jgi:CheY-like chemotaxis protein
VELPAVEASANPAHNQPAAPAPASRRQKVLVVDDNEDAATTMRSGLEALGHDVEVAFDGPSALLRAATFAPTTVLLDIGLPIMDGYEVARQLTRRAGGSPIQVIALTGYGQDVDKARAKAAQFAHHLVKPVDLEVLRRLLDEAPPPHR